MTSSPHPTLRDFPILRDLSPSSDQSPKSSLGVLSLTQWLRSLCKSMRNMITSSPLNTGFRHLEMPPAKKYIHKHTKILSPGGGRAAPEA